MNNDLDRAEKALPSLNDNALGPAPLAEKLIQHEPSIHVSPVPSIQDQREQTVADNLNSGVNVPRRKDTLPRPEVDESSPNHPDAKDPPQVSDTKAKNEDEVCLQALWSPLVRDTVNLFVGPSKTRRDLETCFGILQEERRRHAEGL